MEECIDCYKIKCRRCGWEPNDGEVQRIQKGELTACPTCSWKPGDHIL